MSSYRYDQLAPFTGCAGCENFRRTEFGPPDKERLRPYCLTREGVGRIEGERPQCYVEKTR